jgi:hypothetical protein
MRTGLRPQVRVENEFYDVHVDLIGQDELRPGGSALVGVSFLSPDLVYSRIQAGEKYSVYEGSRQIGTFLLLADVWKDENRRVLIGKDYAATVTSIGWTMADVQLENGWTAGVNSRDVGLVPWAEIREALQVGQQLRVRVEAVDPIARSVTLTILERRQAG